MKNPHRKTFHGIQREKSETPKTYRCHQKFETLRKNKQQLKCETARKWGQSKGEHGKRRWRPFPLSP